MILETCARGTLEFFSPNSMLLRLTELEKDIVKLLLNFIQVYPVNQRPTLRIAGGWVRDKLLGLESNDLDICIDNIKGEPFAKKLFDYCSSLPNDGNTMSRVAKIQSNPDKSKHLETATCKILGLEVF